jgi:hypothetical protein
MSLSLRSSGLLEHSISGSARGNDAGRITLSLEMTGLFRNMTLRKQRFTDLHQELIMSSPSTIFSALACEMTAQGIPYSTKLSMRINAVYLDYWCSYE